MDEHGTHPASDLTLIRAAYVAARAQLMAAAALWNDHAALHLEGTKGTTLRAALDQADTHPRIECPNRCAGALLAVQIF
jgi:hypothetical protein